MWASLRSPKRVTLFSFSKHKINRQGCPSLFTDSSILIFACILKSILESLRKKRLCMLLCSLILTAMQTAVRKSKRVLSVLLRRDDDLPLEWWFWSKNHLRKQMVKRKSVKRRSYTQELLSLYCMSRGKRWGKENCHFGHLITTLITTDSTAAATLHGLWVLLSSKRSNLFSPDDSRHKEVSNLILSQPRVTQENRPSPRNTRSFEKLGHTILSWQSKGKELGEEVCLAEHVSEGRNQDKSNKKSKGEKNSRRDWRDKRRENKDDKRTSIEVSKTTSACRYILFRFASTLFVSHLISQELFFNWDFVKCLLSCLLKRKCV